MSRLFGRSIRLRLTVWYTLTLIAVLSVCAAGIYAFVRHQLFAEFDEHLENDLAVELRDLERDRAGNPRFR